MSEQFIYVDDSGVNFQMRSTVGTSGSRVFELPDSTGKLLAQTGTVDDLVLKVDSSGHSTATVESDGTIVFDGTGTVWDDLNYDPVRSGGPASTRPEDVIINNVIHKEFDSANNEICGSVAEVPHKAKLSTVLYPHIHLFLKAGESVGTTGVSFTFYWELRQDGGTTSGSVVLSATSAQITGGALVSKFDHTGFAGPSTLGSQLAVTIARTAGNAGDIVVTTYGIHYEIDMLGSRGLSTK
jgi:hypothetical protein